MLSKNLCGKSYKILFYHKFLTLYKHFGTIRLHGFSAVGLLRYATTLPASPLSEFDFTSTSLLASSVRPPCSSPVLAVAAPGVGGSGAVASTALFFVSDVATGASSLFGGTSTFA